jgi:hypothetical protein
MLEMILKNNKAFENKKKNTFGLLRDVKKHFY